MSDFEARRQRGIELSKEVVRHGSLTSGGPDFEKACLDVLEAEPEWEEDWTDPKYHEWQRLCTIILDGLGVK